MRVTAREKGLLSTLLAWAVAALFIPSLALPLGVCTGNTQALD